MPGLDPSNLAPRAAASLFAALFAVAALPVLFCDILPLVDYPNHLARMALLAHLPDDPTLQRYYALAWHPIPDLAMDAVVPPLLSSIGLAAAGKVFVLATFLLLAGGPMLLGRTLFGRWQAWPLLAFLLLYGRLLLWGIVNYLFGLGLACCALAAMVALRPRGATLRLAAGGAAALAVYFAHLMAFGVYAVLLAGIELQAMGWRPREGLRRLAVALLPLALPFALLLAAGGTGSGTVSFAQPWRKLDLLFSVFDLYHRLFDIACFALAVVGMGVAYWRRWAALAPQMALPLVLLLAAYAVMPSQMMGASGIDRRMPLALALVLVGATCWTAPRLAQARGFFAVAAALLVLRLATVAQSWHASDLEYRPIVAALAAVPQGSRIAVAAPPDAVDIQATPLVHLPVLAAALDDAFVPTLFALPGQQPIALTPRYAALAAATPPDRLWADFVVGAPPSDGARAILAQYDYVAFTGVRPFALADPRGLTPVFIAPRFQLFRVSG